LIFKDISGTTTVRYGDPVWSFYFFGTNYGDGSFSDAARWCRENFGPVGERWADDAPILSIRDQTDAAAFKLRWC
jgi:hypothetical protein